MNEKLTSRDPVGTMKKWDVERFREFVARIANRRRVLEEKQILVNTANRRDLRKCQNKKGARFRRIQKIASKKSLVAPIASFINTSCAVEPNGECHSSKTRYEAKGFIFRRISQEANSLPGRSRFPN
ncbi:unnamed protein product [Dracunculus medinensis]|uniref:Uncharacterized protein n=1 Tax=Dracunculus medinensis TaxID=318479 RepID=A0A0N4URV8_DRAME|nr:unnamed protein product [Dracunculus medinensis]